MKIENPVSGKNEADAAHVQVVPGNSRFESGYWKGMHQPAFVIELQFPATAVGQGVLERYDQIIESLILERRDHGLRHHIEKHPLLSRLARTSLDVLHSAGMPIMSGAVALPVRGAEGTHWLLGLPAVSHQITAPRQALRWSSQLLNMLAAGDELSMEGLRKDFQKLLASCAEQGPAGINTLRFLQAAHDEGIPWRHVANNVYQFGWGSRSRWLDSSFTDETSRISAGLARDKFACAKVLREAGLPVPTHVLVAAEEQALAAADALGYPVVVKPANLDGGKGVFAGLGSRAAVRHAFGVVSKLCKRILVEKHFEGNDYRLQVYKDEVFWVVRRRPAYVVGDGESTVEMLVQQVNFKRQNVQQDSSSERGHKPIIVDHEVLDWLANQELEINSIPISGQHVRLRGAANISLGGTLEPVMEKAHPDNLAIAVRAAKVLRLDMAGIDLLIPDISRSWQETGALICEVNGQPQLSSHLPRFLLPRLVADKGRIPVVVFFGANPNFSALHDQLQAEAATRKIGLGWVGSGKAFINSELLTRADRDDRAGVRALLADPRTDVLVWHVLPSSSDNAGMPLDRIDFLILDSEAMQAINPAADQFKKLANQTWMLNGSDCIDEKFARFSDFAGRIAASIFKSKELGK